jgi:2-polyprenyl-3-methyl-5-hydroxy-6-metoxy-1,4-benzoquinol methylase
MNTAKEHWEEHYGERDRVWSGRVNVRLVEVVSTLEAGRALDLGCGEGADACWLAERGWTVVAVDISDTALQRAAAEADARGLGDRIDFAQHDLSDSFPDGTFDLISAQLLHSTVPLDRRRILSIAADAVRPVGSSSSSIIPAHHRGRRSWTITTSFPAARRSSLHWISTTASGNGSVSSPLIGRPPDPTVRPPHGSTT